MDAVILSESTTIWHKICERLVEKNEILFAANLLHYDYDMAQMYQALERFRGHQFYPDQKIIFSLYDTEYYLREAKIGLTVENLIRILENLDISFGSCYLFTNHHGLHRAVNERCGQYPMKVFENNFSTRFADPNLSPLERKSSQIEKTFCFMSHTRRDHRSYVRLWINASGLTDQILMTWHSKKFRTHLIPTLPTKDNKSATVCPVEFIYPSPFTRIHDKVTINQRLATLYIEHREVLDVDFVHPAVDTGPNTNNFRAPWLAQTFINIVAETVFDYPYPYLTEKTFKCFWHLSPFIIVGAAHSLDYLRSVGFKTFDRWIDESYDTITDPAQRLECLFGIFNSISNWSLTHCQNVYNEMIPVLEHNLHHYQNYFCKILLNDTQKNI